MVAVREREVEEESFELEGPLRTKLRARGPGAMLALLICTCFAGTVFLWWLHHTADRQDMDELKNSMAEMVYVLSLPQLEREKLQLNMPESLRARSRYRRRGRDE